MGLKNTIISALIAALFFIAPSSFSNIKVFDPLKIPLVIQPYQIQNDAEGYMDISKLLPFVIYDVACTLNTTTDNAPLYLIRNYTDWSNRNITIDGKIGSHANQALVPQSGTHSLYFQIRNYNESGDKPNILFHNASDGIMGFSGCYAMIGQ